MALAGGLIIVALVLTSILGARAALAYELPVDGPPDGPPDLPAPAATPPPDLPDPPSDPPLPAAGPDLVGAVADAQAGAIEAAQAVLDQGTATTPRPSPPPSPAPEPGNRTPVPQLSHLRREDDPFDTVASDPKLPPAPTPEPAQQAPDFGLHPDTKPILVDQVDQLATEAERIATIPQPANLGEAWLKAKLNDVNVWQRERELEAAENEAAAAEQQRVTVQFLKDWTVWDDVAAWVTGRPDLAAPLEPVPAPDLSSQRAALDEANAQRDLADQQFWAMAGQRASVAGLDFLAAPNSAMSVGAASRMPQLQQPTPPPATTPTPTPTSTPVPSPSAVPATPAPAPGVTGPATTVPIPFLPGGGGLPPVQAVPRPGQPGNLVRCPVDPAAPPGAHAELDGNCVAETIRYRGTVKASVLYGQAGRDLRYEVNQVVEDGRTRWRVFVEQGPRAGVGGGLGPGVGYDVGRHDASAAWRLNGDVNVLAVGGQMWEFDTVEESVKFRNDLLQEAALSTARKMVGPALPRLEQLVDWAMPSPLDAYQPRFTYDELGVTAKGKTDGSALLAGGGVDAGLTVLLGDRKDHLTGARTYYIRQGGEVWGGLAVAGIGPSVSGIGKGDAIIAYTVSADGEPLDVSVSLTGAAGVDGRLLDVLDGETRVGLRDRSDKYPNFHNLLATYTRADGKRYELVARIDLQNPTNRKVAGALIAELGFDDIPGAWQGDLGPVLDSDTSDAIEEMVARFRKDGRITLTEYSWQTGILNPEVGIGATVRIGGEALLTHEYGRIENTSVLFWGPFTTLSEQERQQNLSRLREQLWRTVTPAPGATPAATPTPAPAP